MLSSFYPLLAGDRGDRQFEKEKRMGPDGSFQPTYVSVYVSAARRVMGGT